MLDGKVSMKNKKKFRIVRVLLLIIMAVCMFQIVRDLYFSSVHKAEQERLHELTETNDSETSHNDREHIQSTEFHFTDQYMELYRINSDLRGWLTIDGTEIDYPVMQSEDNDYYLEHSFYRKKNKYGCLFVKNFVNIENPETNFIVYGHNMKDGAMFGTLDKFESEDYYKEHSEIHFYTFSELRIYDIVAAFQINLYDEEDEFKYYEFYQAESQEQFEYFYKNIMDRALYDTGMKAEFGDSFITLSTCSYQTENGRFVLVGKQRK